MLKHSNDFCTRMFEKVKSDFRFPPYPSTEAVINS